MQKQLMRKTYLIYMLFMAAISTSVMAQEKSSAVIILDASGSMWGQIGGKTKISIAKDTLNTVVRDWNPHVELGLTVYGHRNKSDCDDIETLIPVGKVDKDQMLATVKNIQPTGKTPISRALQKVANELEHTEEEATIILISDGKESCDPDPCATATLLEKQGVNFVTHVIGFDVDDNESKQLACIATATGGQFLPAKNASSLNIAMDVIVKKIREPEMLKAEFLVRSCLEVGVAEGKCQCFGEMAIEGLKSDLLEKLRLAPNDDIIAMQTYYSHQEIESTMNLLASAERKCEIK